MKSGRNRESKEKRDKRERGERNRERREIERGRGINVSVRRRYQRTDAGGWISVTFFVLVNLS